MTVHEVLVKARNLISDEKDWCGNGWGYGSGYGSGRSCGQRAMFIAAGGDGDEPVRLVTAREPALLRAFHVINKQVGAFFGNFNDSHSHAEVLAAFDAAIAATAPEPDVGFLADVEREGTRV